MAEKHSPETILQGALEIADAEERAAYLEEACGEDQDLRHEVESLLAAHLAASDDFMDTLADPVWEKQTEKAGERIGRYKLLELIGEGGFGRVWMADQREPMQRRVALKIVKLGMDTGEVLARFEAERQALAMMDHPNIAQVFDGGVTESGRPYFVMELVKGVPITEYCDVNKLPPRARIALFRKVCQAVQHAHQKGIIHRDLKPTNILVTVKEDQALPKVIDFGVAKALDTRLTERTLFTRMNQWVGTPAYMSPEQAGLGSLDIDTRSDVYSLGTILYELLTGHTPFDEKELRAEGYEAILRKIREEDAPKASTRLSSLTREELTVIADHRGRTPQKLGHAIKGELDWILLKALERDRTRRYDTANALALDLERYVGGEPITAAPPTFAYQASKFFRKRWKFASIAGAFVIVLLAGTVVSIQQAVKADSARKDAERERNNADRERGQADEARGNAEDALELVENEQEENRRLLAKSDLDHARRFLEDDDHSSAVAHLCRANRREPENKVARWLLLTTLIYGAENLPARPVWTMKTPSNVSKAAFSPDGTKLVAIGEDGLLQGWDSESGGPLFEPRKHFAGEIQFAQDGSSFSLLHTKLPYGDEARLQVQLMILETKTGLPHSRFPSLDLEHGSDAFGLFPPVLRHEDGRWELAILEAKDGQNGLRQCTINVHDLAAQEIVRTYTYEGTGILQVEPSLIGLVTENYLRVFDLWTGESRFPEVHLNQLTSGKRELEDIALSDSGRLIVSTIRIVESESPEVTVVILDPSQPPKVVHRYPGAVLMKVLPNEGGLVLAGDDGYEVTPETDWGNSAFEIPSVPDRSLGMTRFLFGEGDGTKGLWHVSAAGSDLLKKSGVIPPGFLDIDPQGQRAAVRYDHETLCVYDLSYPSALPALRDEVTNSVTTSVDELRRVEANHFGCRFVDRSGDQEIRGAVRHFGLERHIVSPEWTTVITMGFGTGDPDSPAGKLVRLWKFPSGEEMSVPAALLEKKGSLRYLDDETLLRTEGTAATVVSITGDRTRTFDLPGKGNGKFIRAPEDARLFHLAGNKVFEVDPWGETPLQPIADVPNPVHNALSSPDGSVLLVQETDGILRVLDTSTGDHGISSAMLRGEPGMTGAKLHSFVGRDHALVTSKRGCHLLELATLQQVMPVFLGGGEQPPWGDGFNRLSLGKPTGLTNQVLPGRSLPARMVLANLHEPDEQFQLWALPHGHPLTPKMKALHSPVLTHKERTGPAARRPHDQMLKGLKERFGFWEMPFLERALPEEFLQTAEALADRRLNSYGVLERVGVDAVLAAGEVLGRLDASLDPELAPIARWLSTTPGERSVSPFFKSDLESYLNLLVRGGSGPDFLLANLLETDASPVRLAREAREQCIMGAWQRGEHLLSRAVKMAPNHAEVKRLANEVYTIVDPNRTRYPIPEQPKVNP